MSRKKRGNAKGRGNKSVENEDAHHELPVGSVPHRQHNDRLTYSSSDSGSSNAPDRTGRNGRGEARADPRLSPIPDNMHHELDVYQPQHQEDNSSMQRYPLQHPSASEIVQYPQQIFREGRSGGFFEGSSNIEVKGGSFNQAYGHHTNVTIHVNQPRDDEHDISQHSYPPPIAPPSATTSRNIPPPLPQEVHRSQYPNAVPDNEQGSGSYHTTTIIYSPDNSNKIYERHLGLKQRGFPLWIPEPNRELPMQYRREGVHVGDVGIITPSGAFSFLFNICLQRGNPINPLILPKGFTPIISSTQSLVIRAYSEFKPESYLASTAIEKTNNDPPFRGLSFMTSAAEGAVLTLPDGAIARDLENIPRIRAYAAAHIENWYRYINVHRGCEAKNGEVRLVIGCDKATSWGMAAVANFSQHKTHYLKYRSVVDTGGSETQLAPIPLYKWEYTGLAEARVGPDLAEISDLKKDDDSNVAVDGKYWNQCLFMRTLNLTLSEEAFEAINREVEAALDVQMQEFQQSAGPSAATSSHRTIGSQTGSNASDSHRDAQSGKASDTKGSVDSVTTSRSPTAPKSHPADVLNKLLLQKVPNCRVVATQDEDWCSILNEDDEIMPTPSEIAKRVLATHHIREEDGIVYLEPKNERQSALRRRQIVGLSLQGSVEFESRTAGTPILAGSSSDRALVDNVAERSMGKDHSHRNADEAKSFQSAPDRTLSPASPSRGYQSHVFSTSTSLGSSNISDLFALVIGIDKYNNPDYLPLSGSVTDANAVEDYLTSKLRVPKSHIISLRNESATRSAIIQALESDLLQKVRRGTGCPVLIYFAGHGGEIDAPHGWPCSSGKIQMLIPYDCGCLLPQGNTVAGIPDYTLAKHLMNLARRKGDNNILVILDSCFSGTGTRSISDNYGPGVRAVKYRGSLPELPASQTQNQSTARAIRVDPRHALSGLKSHTLLAACKSDEYAREANKHGVFTDALLKTLSKVDITKTTYKELLRKMPQLSSNQNPQCEGQQQDCIIFSTRIKAPHNGNPCEPDPNRSVLYVGVRQRIQVVIDAIQHMPPESDIVLTETPDIAHVSVEDENRQFCFYVHDINVNHYGLYKLPHAISHYATETNLQGILRRIAFYEHHLRRVKTPSNIDGKVLLEFLRVARQPGAGIEEWAYVGNIQPNDLAIGGQINLVQDGSLYVIKLTNTTSRDLYPSLFYFDNCDYSIESLYEPPSPGGHGDGDAPLKAGRSMVIGHGGEGVCPFVLEVDVRNPASAEIGFLKLFISTKHTDYSHIRQYSPFREPLQHAQTQTRGLKDYTGRRKEYFGSILVPLIVRSQYNPSTRGIARGLGEHSLAPPSESHNRTVFKQVMVQRHHRKKLLKWFRGRLGHYQPHQSQSTEMSQIEQQLANINMLDEPYLQSALPELTEMGSDIEELKAGISQLKVEKEQDRSSEELGALKQRIRQMETTTGVRGGYPDN